MPEKIYTIEEGSNNLRQFKCDTCLGKKWYERVARDNSMSKCYDCGNMMEAVPRDEEGENSCTPEECHSNLWQFKCETCPGKHSWQPYKVWYERVAGKDPKSKCHSCGTMRKAVPRGEEKGVFICFVICTCEHRYTVRCEMQDTAPCYRCGQQVSPCHFEPRRRIHRKTDNTHNCSKCGGKGDCPNMSKAVAVAFK